MKLTHCLFVLVVLLVGLGPRPAGLGAEDLLIADFEGSDYGAWSVTGEAFGPGPARGTLPGQMEVSGFEGAGLVNSFFGGDVTTGVLTSPRFTIERPHINFLIGGGMHAGKACMDLLLDGAVVRTATGPNDRPGGTERLGWESWDVSDLVGREVRIRIVDEVSGGWGHINIDQIVQSDRARRTGPAQRTIKVRSRYLHLPVKTGAESVRLRLMVDGEAVRAFDIELVSEAPDFVVYADVSPWSGARMELEVDRHSDGEAALAAIRVSDELPEAERLRRETFRPQYHFTSNRGWLNDPNGLVFYKGEWHLFYQHNPFGWNWGNMHWGHAVSTDLFRWRELGEAIHPWSDVKGAAFSGSAVMDWADTSGFRAGDEVVMVAALTDTDSGEVIAYSNDRGRNWTLYAGNPVWQHQGRDPRVLWHAPTLRWVMAVYDEQPKSEGGVDQGIQFLSSVDLKEWRLESRISGFFECPDLFELPVQGKAEATKWVLYGADGRYVLGGFDGKRFTPEHDGRHQVWWGDFYAAQTYSDAPDGRRVQIGWGRGIEFPGMPFNQQMCVPVELTLRETGMGVRMYAEPVKEIRGLYVDDLGIEGILLNDGVVELEFAAELMDGEWVFEPGDCASLGVVIAGEEIRYDCAAGRLRVGGIEVPYAMSDGSLTMRVLVDRGSMEVFLDGGRAAVSRGVLLGDAKKPVAVFARGGSATLRSARLHSLQP